MNDLASAAGFGVVVALAIVLPTWLASIPLRDASLADRIWSLMIAAPAVFYVWRLGADARSIAMLVVMVAWALRLGVFITVRNWGHGEDRRYRDMRNRNQPNFALKSLWLVFLLQAVLAWVVGLPVLAASGGGEWGVFDTLGLLIAAGGLVVETLADAQLARFRRQPGSRDRVMDSGLWRYSRHPNYFGETCLWWGLGLMGLAGGGWTRAWCLASPMLMTVLLLRVSGVSLLEKDIGERRPAYRDYIARTSAFIPWFPKRRAGA
jgi:steroid 5-alpha reductase family enzyme